MRLLPIYLVLDTSKSMSGEPIAAVEDGVQLLTSTLRTDPYALETVQLSVITFSDHATQLAPLTDLGTFRPPTLRAQGTASLGKALSLAADCISKEIPQSGANVKYDLKPLVFIMTDGQSTDDWQSGLSKFKSVKTGTVVVCATSEDADHNMLKQITHTVVKLGAADTASINAFFMWTSKIVYFTFGQCLEASIDLTGLL